MCLCAAEGKGKGGHIQLDILVEVSSRRVPCLLLPSAAVMCGCLLASLLPPPYPDAALCPGAAVASRSLAQHTQAMGRQNFGCDTGNWDWKGLTSQNVTLNGGRRVRMAGHHWFQVVACFKCHSCLLPALPGPGWVCSSRAMLFFDVAWAAALATGRNPTAMLLPPLAGRQAAARLGDLPPAAG